MHKDVNGLVLREVSVGERDKILTVLCEDLGKITVSAKGAKSYKSQIFAVAQTFCYGSFTLFLKGDRYLLDSGEPTEKFSGLQKDVVRLALAGYITKICDILTDEFMPEDMLLRLALNSLFALSERETDHRIIKAAFELRAASLCGYMPHIDGEFLKDGTRTVRLGGSVLAAVKYIIGCDLSKIFSFNIEGESKMQLCEFCEDYICRQTEQSPKALAFYKSLI